MDHFLKTKTLLAKRSLKRIGQFSKAGSITLKKPSPAFKQGFRRGFSSFSDLTQTLSKPTSSKKTMNIIHFSGGDVKLAWTKVGEFIEEASDNEVKQLGGK